MRDFNQEYKDAVDFSKYAYEFDDIIRKFMMRTFAPFLPSGKALELGCYKGHFTDLLSEHYDHITVVEASSELAVLVAERFKSKVKMVNGLIENVKLPEQYDAIFLIHTLEHIDDPQLVLRRIREWLSPTGRLFVAVPNGNAASRQIAVKMGLIPYNTAVTEAEFVHGHRRTYTLDTLAHDLSSAQLRNVHSGGVFFKSMANFQFDKMLQEEIIDENYLEGCYKLGTEYPNLCASIFSICEKG